MKHIEGEFPIESFNCVAPILLRLRESELAKGIHFSTVGMSWLAAYTRMIAFNQLLSITNDFLKLAQLRVEGANQLDRIEGFISMLQDQPDLTIDELNEMLATAISIQQQANEVLQTLEADHNGNEQQQEV
ncbi:MAG: hypothetical protein OEX12_01195 [Gammaproteobacteria bacterium]|nr:hypothetical protein [Gammaproteobacteria bacterium]